MSGSSESGRSLVGQDSPEGLTIEATPDVSEQAAAEPWPWTALLTGVIGGAVAAILVTFLLKLLLVGYVFTHCSFLNVSGRRVTHIRRDF